MIANFPTPVLAVATDVLRDLEGADALYALWTLFTKCKGSLKDGQRLENLSWRLWYREMVESELGYRQAALMPIQTTKEAAEGKPGLTHSSQSCGVPSLASSASQSSTKFTTLLPPSFASSSVSPSSTNEPAPSQPHIATPPIKPEASNVSAASAYRSPAPSVASVCSPSASTISFSEYSNGNASESDSGAMAQTAHVPSSYNTLSVHVASDSSFSPFQADCNCNCDPQQGKVQENNGPSNSEIRKSHIPSPITSPSPSPCPSSPTPSQTVICDHPPADTAVPHNGTLHDSTGVMEMNGDFRGTDAKPLVHRIDISEQHGALVERGSGVSGDASHHRTGSNGQTLIHDMVPSEVASVMVEMGRDAKKFELHLPGTSSGRLIATKNVRYPVAIPPRRPSAIGRIICHIIPRRMELPPSTLLAHRSQSVPTPSPALSRSREPVTNQMVTHPQRNCPLPTPEHESNGLNLTLSKFRDNAHRQDEEAIATVDNSNPAITLTISPSTQPFDPPSGPIVSYSNPATPNRSPTHSSPNTPQRQSPMSSLPPTPRTSAGTYSAKNLGLAPRVVIVNPTPQPTPHPTPPATPTLPSTTAPPFVTSCGVGLGLHDSNILTDSTSAQLPVPTAVLPVASGPVPTLAATVSPTPNHSHSDDDAAIGPVHPGVAGPVSGVRGPLPVPELREELPPGKPPCDPKPLTTTTTTSKPDLSVIVGDKDRTLKPSDTRFFLLQSPEERSPDSATTSMSASSGHGGGDMRRRDGSSEKNHDGSGNGSLNGAGNENGRLLGSPNSRAFVNRGRDLIPETTKKEASRRSDTQMSSHKRSESMDATIGAKAKERSLSRDARPLSRTRNRSSGVLAAGKRTVSTTTLAGTGTRVRPKGLGLGGGLTMTKGKTVVGKAGLAGRGAAAGLKRSTSGSIVPHVEPSDKAAMPLPSDPAKGKAKVVEDHATAVPSNSHPDCRSKTQTQTPARLPRPPPLGEPKEVGGKHRAMFNIGSGSSEGMETSRSGEGSSREPMSGSASRGSASRRKLDQPSAGLTRPPGSALPRADAVPNNGLRNAATLSKMTSHPGASDQQATKNNVTFGKAEAPARSPSPPMLSRLPNPAALALNPEAANAALQPSRKRVVVTNTSSEDYETTDIDEDDEDEDGSWASEDLSEDEITFARGGAQNGAGASNGSKRSHTRGGSIGGRGKGASSSHSRGVGSSKIKGRSPGQQAARPPQAQRTKSEAPQQQPGQQQQQHPAAPPLVRRHTSHAIQGQRRVLSKEDEAALKLQAAAVEAQRQRELFTKVPVQQRGPGGIQRTRSGLLSQLMNPDPSIFPANHPYRQSYSAVDLRRMANVPRVVSAGADRFAVLNGANGIAPMPSVADMGSNHARHPTTERTEQAPLPKPPPMVGSLRTSKGAAAVPLAAQVTVTQVPVVNGSGAAAGAYRPKGRPQGEELEDETDTDDNGDNAIQVSKSYAHQKLAELAGRRTAPANGKQQQPAPKRPPLVRALTTIEPTPNEAVTSTPPVAVLAHPYNLPPPPPPSTPRATRRRMLQSEMSESLRRNLLWERQVSKVYLGPPRRRSTGTAGPNGASSRPGHLTTTPSMVQLSAKTSNTTVREAEERERERRRETEQVNQEELRRRAIARTRSWADDWTDYHRTGW